LRYVEIQLRYAFGEIFDRYEGSALKNKVADDSGYGYDARSFKSQITNSKLQINSKDPMTQNSKNQKNLKDIRI
jgi:hypothetical protein